MMIYPDHWPCYPIQLANLIPKKIHINIDFIFFDQFLANFLGFDFFFKNSNANHNLIKF